MYGLVQGKEYPEAESLGRLSVMMDAIVSLVVYFTHCWLLFLL